MLRLSRHSSILKSTQRLLLHTTSLLPEDPSFGRVVEGIDLGNLDKATLDECVALVYRYGLVVFRGQEQLSPFDELSFAKAFNHDTSGEQQSYTGGAAPQAKLPPPLDDIAVIGSFELENYHGLEKASSGGVYPPWPKGQLYVHNAAKVLYKHIILIKVYLFASYLQVVARRWIRRHKPAPRLDHHALH
jgi:hypothetical protein